VFWWPGFWQAFLKGYLRQLGWGGCLTWRYDWGFGWVAGQVYGYTWLGLDRILGRGPIVLLVRNERVGCSALDFKSYFGGIYLMILGNDIYY
jgi:hypothetical protein